MNKTNFTVMLLLMTTGLYAMFSFYYLSIYPIAWNAEGRGLYLIFTAASIFTSVVFSSDDII